MKFVAKVFKSGNSLAVRLPAALNVKTRELSIEQGRDGDIILYDEKERRQSREKRLREFEKLIEDIRNNPIEDDEPTPHL